MKQVSEVFDVARPEYLAAFCCDTEQFELMLILSIRLWEIVLGLKGGELLSSNRCC